MIVEPQTEHASQWKKFCPPGDVLQRLETFWVVTTQSVQWACLDWVEGRNRLTHRAAPEQRIIWHKIAAQGRLAKSCPGFGS